MNVTQAARRAGTSVRTMRYYEEIGLIRPAREENGYREYGEEEVERVRLIRAYRELQFSLDEIGILMNAPRTQRDEMLQSKIEEMELKRQRIDNRIALAHFIRMTGLERLTEIDFAQLDDQMNQSRMLLEQNAEMKALSERLSQESEEKGEAIAEELIQNLAGIGNAPESKIDEAIQNLKSCIERYFYPCTDKILAAYARAYGGDGILAQAVDEAGGEGAAKRMRERVEEWVNKK